MRFQGNLLSATLLSACLLGLGAGLAVAETAVFNNPKTGSYRVDWCYKWGVQCGADAATRFCSTKGFDTASGFVMAPDIGGTSPTKVLGTGEICDEPFCDGFKSIQCERADAEPDESEEVTYTKPRYKGRRLDWCLTWAANCGKPAADAYCKYRGHDEAVALKIAENIGLTRIIKTGQVCNDPGCDGFKFITCSTAP